MKQSLQPDNLYSARSPDETASPKEGFEKIFYQYQRQLYYVALKYLKSPRLAEDAVQDVFLKLWIKRETLDPDQSIKSFLFVSLKNHILNIIRHEKLVILRHIEIMHQTESSKNDTEYQSTYNEYSDILERAVESLPRKRRIIFKLKTFKGLKNDEIAHKLGISVHTVKVQYQMAVKHVKNRLGHYGGITIQLIAVSLASFLFR